MADHQKSVPRAAAGYREGRRDGRETSDDRRYSAYEVGESSSAGGSAKDTGQRDTVLFHGPGFDFLDDEDPLTYDGSKDASTQQPPPLAQGIFEFDDDDHDQDFAYREGKSQKKQRHRASGGFLLQDAVAGVRNLGFRRNRTQLHSSNHSSASTEDGNVQERKSSSSDRGKRQVSMPIRHSIGDHPPVAMDHVVRDPRRFSDSHSQQAPARLDMDSSQIVHMALNLSENRRINARRNAARIAPPRLAPLPDATAPSNLKQHLQQQRKTSRNASMKIESGSRIPSAGSGLGASYSPTPDPAHDAQYTYQFSSSTLARAQKAKEHLELLAQYRRLLEVLPPLKPGVERPSSNPTDYLIENSRPGGFVASLAPVTLGRQYNPLQYIRNRKVRAREKQNIDGDQQGFGDVEGVRSWVDTVYRQMSLAGTSLLQDKASIPPFPGAVQLEKEAALEPMLKNYSRSRRPRADWLMEPCDMIADAYWLDHDGNKGLIEDRSWRKIFPSLNPEMNRPISREVEDLASKMSPLSVRINEKNDPIIDDKEAGLAKVRTDLSHGSAKERAKLKLQTIKGGFHPRHSGTGHGHHDSLHKRGSMSDLSDSEPEVGKFGKRRSKPTRKGTISSHSNDLVQKQMLEIMANEVREKELGEVTVSQHEIVEGETPDKRTSSKPSSRFASRNGSMAEYSDSERRAAIQRTRLGSPIKRGLYTSDLYTGSVGHYSSLPNSPDLPPIRNGVAEFLAASDISPPWSRSASPIRNPLTKIKQIIRDKSGESYDSLVEDTEDDRARGSSRRNSTIAPSDSTTTLDKRQSGTSMPLSSFDGFKHNRSSSTRLRPDEQVGLRGMFKGPRIDTVIRGGVSKLGDKIWRKDGSSESPGGETTDESDNDRVKDGRAASPLSLSRRGSRDGRITVPKSYLDSMPQFLHAPDYQGHGIVDVSGTQSSRLDLLKPPVVDVRSVIPSLSPPPGRKAPTNDSDLSESESYPGSVPSVVRGADRRLNSALALTKLDSEGRTLNRHWSIADGDKPTKARLSKREVARMKALILSSGVKAMEITRRANEQHKPFNRASMRLKKPISNIDPTGMAWEEIASLGPRQLELHDRQVPFHELYPLAAQTLSIAIQSWGQRWQTSADRFTNRTAPDLRKQVWDVRSRLADELSEMTRKAADECDETNRDLALGQPLKVKHVVDTIEKMLRRRRRRFRWVRRAMWLTVEWLLVGFMWYVWFVVMILRIFLGVGKGVLKGVKWLLWL